MLQKAVQFKPAQHAVKALAAGTVVCAAMWAAQKTSKAIFGTSETPLKTLQPLFDPSEHSALEYLSMHEPEFLDIVGRLQTFRRFDPQAFFFIVLSMESASKVKFASMNATTAATSFKVRKAYQQIIETVRVFRAILEIKVPVTLEDFDEIAVDINAKVEQACTDAIQDTYA